MADLNVVYRIAADISGLQDGVNKAAASTQKLENMASLAGKALLAAFGTATVLGGLQRLVGDALKYADALSNLKARTDVSLQGLQKMEAIGLTAGVSMETLARSVTMLQKNLDSPAARQALTKIGMDFEHIKALSPEDQFFELARALAAIEDPIDRANLGTALFGRTWDQVAGAFNQNVDAIIDGTTRMTDAQIVALEKSGDAFDLWALNVWRNIRATLGDMVLIRQETDAWLNSFGVVGQSLAMIRRQTNVGELPEVKTPKARVAEGPQAPIALEYEGGLVARIIRESEELEAKREQIRKKAQQQEKEDLEHHLKMTEQIREQAWEAQYRMLDFNGTREKERLAQEYAEGQAALADNIAASEEQRAAAWAAKAAELDRNGVAEKERLASLYAGTRAEADFTERELRRNYERMRDSGVYTAEALQAAWDEWYEASHKTNDAWKKDLDLLAGTFTQLSQIAGQSLSAITRGIGGVIAATSGAMSAIDTMKKGIAGIGDGKLLSGIAGLVSGIGGIVGMATAAVGAVKALWSGLKSLFGGGEIGTIVNPARDAWFNKYGGSVQDVGDKLAPFMDGEQARQMIERVFNAKTKEQFDTASAAIDSITGLARGGLVRQPMLAKIGEEGPELVTPLKDLDGGILGFGGRQWDAMQSQLERINATIAKGQREMPRQIVVAWKDALAH